MKISLNHLKNSVDINVSPEELCNRMVMAGFEVEDIEKQGETRNGKLLRQERYSGVMQRSFYVGDAIREEDVKASYENGVLHLMILKKDAARVPARRTIMIEG